MLCKSVILLGVLMFDIFLIRVSLPSTAKNWAQGAL